VVDLPLAVLALHQRSAPLDSRERLLELVAPWRGRADRVVLATCHRVEVYLAGEAAAQAPQLAAELRAGGIAEALVQLHGQAAATQLFAVATGLDSAVQGESQIRGQVRAALASAPASLDPLLRRLLERALRLARTLRREAGLASMGRSVGSLAVDEVLRLVADPGRTSVLVVGAGETGSLAVRALSRRVGRVVVANRDLGRARELARSVGAAAVGLADVPAQLAQSDAVISAADTRGTLLTEDVLAGRIASGPLAVVDIAVPRSVAPGARGLSGLVYRSVDDLDGARALSTAEAARLRAACASEADRFSREAAERAAATAIVKMRAHAEAIRERQLQRSLRQLGHLSARDRRVVVALSARVVNALLHGPTLAMKREPARGDEALALFGLARGRE
jgi:glutamyl-tRNA reductase